jgi:hypothetical protein
MAKRIIHSANQANITTDADSSVSINQKYAINVGQSVGLPKIDIAKFNGQYDNWLEFRDTFSALIHNNTSVAEITKFQCLRSFLVGDAAQVIKSLELSAENYGAAWQLLCERYDNRRLLIDNHIKGLFNLEKITKESASEIRKLIDDTWKYLRALVSLGEDVSSWDTLIIYMITTKLDNRTSREWEQYKITKECTTLNQLKTFPGTHANLLETIDQNEAEKFTTNFNNPARKENKSFITSTESSCPVCNDNEHHAMHIFMYYFSQFRYQ